MATYLTFIPTFILLTTLISQPTSSQVNSRLKNIYQSQWISNHLSSGLVNYLPYGLSKGSECSVNGKILKRNLKNMTFWAVQMIDSWGRPPLGLIHGNNFDFGSYEECVSIDVPQYEIKGVYMIVNLTFWPTKQECEASWNNSIDVYKDTAIMESAWEALKETKDVRIRKRNEIDFALCVPSGCSTQDVEHSLTQTLKPLLIANDIGSNIKVIGKFTHSRVGEEEYTFAYNVFRTGAVSIVLFVLLCTFIDMLMATETEKGQNVLQSSGIIKHFSLVRNIPQLFNTKNEEFGIFSGLKVISMLIVIYGHRWWFIIFGPLLNPENIELVTGSLSVIMLYNGYIVVNTFIAITGFFSYNKMLKSIEKGESINICSSVFRRWMRFTPPYLIVFGIALFIMPYCDNGPLSRSVVWDFESCSSVWWTHLLYINNYVLPEKQCLIPTWYVAVDMQLYLMCTIVAYITYKNKLLGKLCLYSLLVASFVIPILTIYFNDYNGTTLIYPRLFPDIFEDGEFKVMYLQTQNRAAPFLIGMVCATLYPKIRSLNIKLSTFQRLLGWLVTWTIMLTAFLSANIFYIPGRKSTITERLIYAIGHRITWLAFLPWTLLISNVKNSSNFDFVDKFLRLSLFQALQKLSYTVLLVHSVVQLYFIGHHQFPVNYRFLNTIYYAASDWLIVYIISIIFYLFFEAPFLNLIRS